MKYLLLVFSVLIGFNVFVWNSVLSTDKENLDIYFLNVGQGDSELVFLPGGATVLIDGGPDKEILFELSRVLDRTNRYIDLVIVTHPEEDHFAGLYDVIERYKIGSVIMSGREKSNEAWDQFVSLLETKNVPIVFVEEGDLINYKDSSFSIISPSNEFLYDGEINDSSIVLVLNSEGVKTFFSGDIGFDVESVLVDKYDINSDILKVSHHGSKYATSQKFLDEVTPKISVIEVGKNSFGHPTQATLNRLMEIGSSIYRTDENGTVHIRINNGLAGVFID
jgi:competence protein ComEC